MATLQWNIEPPVDINVRSADLVFYYYFTATPLFLQSNYEHLSEANHLRGTFCFNRVAGGSFKDKEPCFETTAAKYQLPYLLKLIIMWFSLTLMSSASHYSSQQTTIESYFHLCLSKLTRLQIMLTI